MACYLIKDDLIPVDEEEVPTNDVYPISFTSGGFVVMYWKDWTDPKGESKYFAISYSIFMVMGFNDRNKQLATEMRRRLESKVNI